MLVYIMNVEDKVRGDIYNMLKRIVEADPFARGNAGGRRVMKRKMGPSCNDIVCQQQYEYEGDGMKKRKRKVKRKMNKNMMAPKKSGKKRRMKLDIENKYMACGGKKKMMKKKMKKKIGNNPFFKFLKEYTRMHRDSYSSRKDLVRDAAKAYRKQ